MNIIPFLSAAVDGQQLLHMLLVLVVWGIIFWVLWWALSTINPPEPWKKVGTVVLVLLTVLVLVNILLGLIGHPLIEWK